MAIDSASPRTRRALLTAALGAGAATLASAIGRPLSVQATDGQTIVVGGEYTANSVTKLTNTTNTGDVIRGESKVGRAIVGDSDQYTGVTGLSHSGVAVSGFSDLSYGVKGTSDSSVGVRGYSYQSIGVIGASRSTGGSGVYGYATASSGTANGVGGESSSTSGRGVYGRATAMTGTTYGLYGRSDSTNGFGVYARATSSSGTTYGVYGRADSPTSSGVHGKAYGHSTGVLGSSGPDTMAPLPKTGVYGVANQDATSVGVRGHSASGIGVHATAGAIGTALTATGRVRLDNCAGVATVASGAKSVLVTPGIELDSSSSVVATLSDDAGGSTTVKRVAVDIGANTFTIYLTANSTVSVKVAWHVFG